MGYDFSKQVNPSILKIDPYQPGKSIEELQRESGLTHIIKLASNENPLGASPRAIEAARNSIDKIHLYPDGSGFVLKQKLANHLQVEPNQITLGMGSDNVLALIAQAFVGLGKEIIVSEYAFATFTIIAHSVGAIPISVPSQNWGHDLNAMLKAITKNTQLIFLANPNNPTGTCFNERKFNDFIAQIPAHILVVVDEAYYEYAASESPDTLKLQNDFPNLIVTRTFSKIYGLAGLRVGYGISTPTICELLNRIRLPFNVSTPAQLAACAALEDKIHVTKSLTNNKLGMVQLVNGFKKLGLSSIPSSANFVTVDLGREAKQIYASLLKEGIIVRPLAGYRMPNHLRITIGLPEENMQLLASLAKVLNF